MQNGKSRIKRVASAIIAGVMALQTVAPVISYADDTASSVATTDDSDAIANVDPGTPVQVDATASEEPSEAPSSGASQADENSEETETNSDITDEVANEHTDADTADETQTVEEDAPKQDESTSETTDTAPSRTVTVTLNKNGGIFEPEWLETANEDPIATYLGTETNDIAIEDAKTGRIHTKKRFGKSLSRCAPAMFITILTNKVTRYGGKVIKVSTFETKASQFDHTDESYTKKKLSERMAHLSSGEVVQRDLYSAFLLEHIDTESLEYNTEALKSAFPAFLKMHENTKKHLQKEENNLPASVGF